MATRKPVSVTVRSYQVGFGDCFLLSFDYPERSRIKTRRVLIDFGTSALPKRSGRKSMLDIAKNIRDVCGKRLDAIVVTHRHLDHLSGFAGRSGGIIEQLKPRVVVQPWTEDPKAAVDAKRPSARGRRRRLHLAGLDSMHDVARFALGELDRHPRGFTKTVRDQLSFLGEDNLKNAAAVKKLMKLKCRYVYYKSRSGFERLLPGVKVHVLGPPTLEQSDKIRKQRHEDASEFWHLQALAGRKPAGIEPRLFKSHKPAAKAVLPFETRWFLPRLDKLRGEELLQIVRILDKQMNNTSVILLFEVGDKKLLFSGDAQIENWSYALKTAEDKKRVRKLLSDVDFYKVGHHGSLNATPKTLWGLFKKKSESKDDQRMHTVNSTMTGKHGSRRRNTEVPRRTLVQALEKQTDYFTTQELRGNNFFDDFTLKIG